MCGCTNNGNNSNQCTIILIIIIFALQGLLNGSTQSKTALILLFVYWLCAGRCGNSAVAQNTGCGNSCAMPTCSMPVNSCCMPVSMHSQNCCNCRRKRHHHDNCTCKCKRIKVCCNNSGCC